MFKLRALSSLVIVLLCGSSAMSQWQAAVGRVSITPEQPVWMAGYAARQAPSNGVLHEIYARLLLLVDADGHRLAIVTMDLIEIPDSLRSAILDRLGKQHRLQPHEILLNVSHTHGGPMVASQTALDWGLDSHWAAMAERYAGQVVDKLDDMLGKTMTQLQVAKLHYHHARCGFAMNRRLPTSGGFRLAPNPDGMVDHDVPVLRIEASGKMLGVLFGYACHNTALGPTQEIHGDYAGFAASRIEQEYPGAIALFLAGCGGDQDPSPRRDLEDAKQNGLALASAVDGAMAAESIELSSTLSSKLESVPLPFAPLPSRESLASQAASGNGFVARHAQRILNRWPNAQDQPEDYQYPVQVTVLGSRLVLVALGGEPVAEYALRIKSDLSKRSASVWVAGYSNLSNAYIPSRRVLREGGYEGTEAIIYQSLPAPFQEQIEDRIIGVVERLTDEQMANKVK